LYAAKARQIHAQTHFNGSIPHLFSSSTFSETESLRISGTGFLSAACPSCHPTNSVKALKKTQSTDPSQWPGLILSSSTTGFPIAPFMPACQITIILTWYTQL